MNIKSWTQCCHFFPVFNFNQLMHRSKTCLVMFSSYYHVSYFRSHHQTSSSSLVLTSCDTSMVRAVYANPGHAISQILCTLSPSHTTHACTMQLKGNGRSSNLNYHLLYKYSTVYTLLTFCYFLGIVLLCTYSHYSVIHTCNDTQ